MRRIRLNNTKQLVENRADRSLQCTHKLRVVILLTSIIGFLAGLYMVILLKAPSLETSNLGGDSHIFDASDAVMEEGIGDEQDDKNYLVIAKMKLSEEIFEGGEEALSKGVYHKFPERGNPEKVGNFLLTAHRLELGLTPSGTRKKSPFYNIDVLEVDDEIKVIWNQVEYVYVIHNIYIVKPNQMEVEAQTLDTRLTLYTCTLGGSDEGRMVIEAFPK